jgi:hypothetical protein
MVSVSLISRLLALNRQSNDIVKIIARLKYTDYRHGANIKLPVPGSLKIDLKLLWIWLLIFEHT